MTAETLRQSILQLAIQGKLVPQDPNDEPAFVMLEKIRNEQRTKLGKEYIESYIYRDDNCCLERINGITEDITVDIPFDAPVTWGWIRLANATYNHGQKVPTNRISYIDIGSIDNIKHKLNNDENLIDPNKIPVRARRVVEKDDILYSTVRPYLHNVCIIDREFSNEPIASTGFVLLHCKPMLNTKFLFYYLISPIFDQYAAYKNSTGSLYPAINGDRLYKGLVPVPPFAEQQRIVDAIEKFEPLLEEYDHLEKESTKLNSEIKDKLKASILQYAIQGKLVPQDPTDEPVSTLLEKIRIEKKAKLGKKYVESYVKNDNGTYYEIIGKQTKDITNDIPFEIPASWEWVKLPYIGYSNLGKTLNKAVDTGKPRQYLCSINVYWNRICLDEIKTAPFTESEIEKYSLRPGDLLICEGGEAGRSAVWEFDTPMLYQNALHRVRFYGNIEPRFYLYVLELYKSINILSSKSKGVTISHLVQTELNTICFPLPPLEEQHRIVAKLDEIFAQLDTIEQALT